MATQLELRDELQKLAGFDLDNTEANRLLNEGDAELCTRSGWTRRKVSVGNTVANQAEYAFPITPTAVFRPLKVWVDGKPYRPSDEFTVTRIDPGEELRLRARGLWYLADDGDLGLHPTPTTGGKPITASCVVYPTPMTADGHIPAAPDPFARGIVHYVAAVSLGESEDEAADHVYHRNQFDSYVARLQAHRLSRAGSGPVQIRVEM